MQIKHQLKACEADNLPLNQQAFEPNMAKWWAAFCYN